VKLPKTKRGWAGLGCGSILVLLVLCRALGAAVGDRTPQTAQVVSGPTEVTMITRAPATEAPAATEAPTEAPTQEPTEELTVAPTTEPTAEPVAASDADTDRVAVQQYFATVGPKLGTFGEALTTFGELLQSPQLADDGWKIQVAAAIAVMNVTYDELDQFEPVPTPVQRFHATLVDATKDCSDAGTLIARAIDQQDSNMVQESLVLMQQCSTKINDDAKPMLDELVAQYAN
jgi:hypothetical protein